MEVYCENVIKHFFFFHLHIANVMFEGHLTSRNLYFHLPQSVVSRDDIWRDLRFVRVTPFSGNACKLKWHFYVNAATSRHLSWSTAASWGWSRVQTHNPSEDATLGECTERERSHSLVFGCVFSGIWLRKVTQDNRGSRKCVTFDKLTLFTCKVFNSGAALLLDARFSLILIFKKKEFFSITMLESNGSFSATNVDT